MKTAIVSGANGFIGSAVVRELLSNGYYVQGLVHNNISNIGKHPNLKIVQFSLETIDSIIENLEPSEIFYHFAWNGISGPIRSDTELQLNNVRWTINALKSAKTVGCKRFVCSGSLVEYEALATLYEDNNRPGTEYIYGGAKLAAHIMCKCVASDIDIDLLWGIITNAYGPGEISNRLVNTTLRKIINGETPRFTSATQNYDFIYIDDVAKAFRLIGEKGVPFSEYLIGSSNAKPLKDYLMEMNQIVAKDMNFTYGDIPFSGTNLPIGAFDAKKIENDTGFVAELPFKEGIKRTFDWLNKQ